MLVIFIQEYVSELVKFSVEVIEIFQKESYFNLSACGSISIYNCNYNIMPFL